MKCVICRQEETQPGLTTVTLERGGMTFVIKGVPALVCQNCGEEYVDEQVSASLLRQAEEAAGNGVQVDIRCYKAA